MIELSRQDRRTDDRWNLSQSWPKQQAGSRVSQGCSARSHGVSNLQRKLGSQNLCLLYGRRHGQEMRGVGHQCFGNGPVEVSLPSRLIGKRIDYGERGWAQAQREPQRSGRFLICQLKTLSQEGGDLFFLPRFRLKSYKQPN